MAKRNNHAAGQAVIQASFTGSLLPWLAECPKAASSGAPAEVGILVQADTLQFTTGEPVFYESSPGSLRGFCAKCGSRLVWMSPQNPEYTNISAGCLDHPENVVPTMHTYVGSQMPWYTIADGLPRNEEG